MIYEYDSLEDSRLPPPGQPKPTDCPHCKSIGVYVRGNWMSFIRGPHAHYCPVLEEKLKEQEMVIAALKKSEKALKDAVKYLKGKLQETYEEQAGPSL